MDRGIYPAALAERFKKRCGQKYRPSNGDEGERFASNYCDLCEKDRVWREQEKDPCQISSYAYAVDIDDPEYPAEWQYGADGQPTCTAFEPERDPNEPDPPQRCDKTLDMFGDHD